MSEPSLINKGGVELGGAWTMERAAELQRLLADQLSTLAELEPRPEQIDLSLSDLCDIDACGCQLLLVFVENLRRRGIAPAMCGMSELVMEKIALLGFGEPLAGTSLS